LAAAPPRLTEADAQAYQQERFRLFRAQIEADLGITRAEIERIRGAYVALLPVDPEARRAELEALKRELHLDDLDPTPATKRRRTKKANPLSLQEHIARQSAEAAKNKGPMGPLARPSWLPQLPQFEANLESATAQPAALVWERDGMYHRAKAGPGHYLVGPTETPDGDPFDVMHFPTGQVIAEERRDLGTAKSLKAAKAMATSDWAKRGATKPTALEWKSVTPDLEPSFPFQRPTLQ
jgi:hypothetical protein